MVGGFDISSNPSVNGIVVREINRGLDLIASKAIERRLT